MKDDHGLERCKQEAMETYLEILPDYEVIPINCSILANGHGGEYYTTYSVPDINN
jgi:hypothetical protein